MSVTAIASLLVGPIAELLGKIIPDKDEAAKLAYEIATLAEKQTHDINLAQIEVNKEEAKSPSIFKGGWRPAAGWVCVIALANNYIIYPYVDAFSHHQLPLLDMSGLMPVLLGMLGLVTARSFEKSKGVAAP